MCKGPKVGGNRIFMESLDRVVCGKTGEVGRDLTLQVCRTVNDFSLYLKKIYKGSH
jgi:hypothetical protein